ncbi:hypothetical protein [Aquimarina longa]|uniref:hypothetical protein n=1 Tax=Aquimarina longa TaxID=1080221 RepID=UPI00078669A3|nr:hypothetical protein [Aquimarina longa]
MIRKKILILALFGIIFFSSAQQKIKLENNNHLPEISSAEKFKQNGMLLVEEELTLYTIAQEKKLNKQANDIEELKLIVKQLLESKK